MIQNQLPPSDDDTLLAEFSAFLTQAGPWSTPFNRLASDLAIRNETHEELSCDTCQELLDIYIEDEQAGKNVRQTYPTVWQHLMTCSDCEMVYDLLAAMLQPEPIPEPKKEKKRPLIPKLPELPAISELPELPAIPELPALPAIPELPAISGPASPEPEPSWTTELQQAYDSFRAQFTFALSYLHSLYYPHLLVRQMRSVTSPQPAPHILLYEDVSVGEQILNLKVTATRHEQDILALQAIVYSDEPLPSNLSILLTWGNETRSVSIDEQGQAELGEVPLISLQNENEKGLFAIELASGKKEE